MKVFVRLFSPDSLLHENIGVHRFQAGSNPELCSRKGERAYQILKAAGNYEVAAEQRQMIAHGVSRGIHGSKIAKPRQGRKKTLQSRILSPLRGSFAIIAPLPRLTPWAII
jgi:hypothetical protein